MKFAITKMNEVDFGDWLAMCNQLHDHNSSEENEKDLRWIQKDDRYEPFLAKDKSGKAAGYIELSTRSDYVENSESSPVGYIESIFVQPQHRKAGLGRQMVEFAEQWCRDKGYTELGSDAVIDNTLSHQFHKGVGFSAEPIMTFIKKV